MLLTAPAQCEGHWCVRARLASLPGRLGPGLRAVLTWEGHSLPSQALCSSPPGGLSVGREGGCPGAGGLGTRRAGQALAGW